MAARQIIALDVRTDAVLSVTAVFWLVTPASMVRPNPSATSVLPPVATVSWGITATELAALQAGTVREFVTTITGPTSATVTQVQNALIQARADQQNALNGEAPAGHWIGTYFDGTTWTAAP